MERNKIWSTAGLAPGRALAFWNDAVSSAFLDVRTESPCAAQPFRARLQSTELGGLAINRLRAQSYRVIGEGTGGDRDWVFVNLHQRGRCRLRQLGREQWVEAGGVSLNLGSAPFRFDFDDEVAMTCLRLPLPGLAARTGRLHDAAARPLPAGAASRLFLGYARQLVANAAQLQSWEAVPAANALLDLLALGLGCSRQEDASAGRREALYRSACAYLEANLGDPGLDLAGLCHHLRLAPRTVQAMFRERATTFTERLLELRLQAADRLIAQGSYGQLAQVAYAVGFADQSYFNRVFRRRFGMTPGERRHRQDDASGG